MEWLSGLSGSIVGLDTAPLVYYMEENQDFLHVVQPFFEALDQSAFQVVTSTLTLLEALVHPLRHGDETLADQYRDILLNSEGLRTVPVTHGVAEIAARLRSRYVIRTPDAIQVATAIHQGATFFLTNDHRLSAISELQVLILNELVG